MEGLGLRDCCRWISGTIGLYTAAIQQLSAKAKETGTRRVGPTRQELSKRTRRAFGKSQVETLLSNSKYNRRLLIMEFKL